MMKEFFTPKDYNKPLFESENFIVIPSLGSLVEGWLLIIPKTFYLNYSQLELPLFDELITVIDYIEKNFLPKFGTENFVLFEHGPTLENSLAGCGVDYAHLHFVPTNLNLIKGIDEFLFLNYTWQEMSSISSLTDLKEKNSDYLFLRDQNNNQFFTLQNNIPSQTFRKVIANYLNIPNSYDWKQNFGIENVNSTINKLGFQVV